MNDSELDMICKKKLDKKYYFLAEKSFCKDDNPKVVFFHWFCLNPQEQVAENRDPLGIFIIKQVNLAIK